MKLKLSSPRRERTWLGVILLAGLIHGLLFVLLAPPWQHYDEPGNFEYAWLIANRSGLPQKGEYDQDMRRELAASMIEHHFFAGNEGLPNLLSQNDPIWIGISQVGDEPVYFWLAALPLRLVRTSDITFQLYLCRLVSLLLYLVTILAAYYFAREITPQGSPLRLLLPLTLALMPGFTDLMTAVNNDVGAAAFFSLYLWLSVRLIRQGISRKPTTWLLPIGVAVLAVLCYFTKKTAFVALPLLPLSLLFVLLRERRRRLAWGLIGLAGLGVLVLLIIGKGAASWYSEDWGNGIRLTVSAQPGGGTHALEIPLSSAGQVRPQAAQTISFSAGEDLRGQPVTLGFWAWADQPAQFRSPTILDGSSRINQMVQVETEPTFYTLSAMISSQASYVAILLEAVSQQTSGTNRLHLDSLILVEGDLTQQGTPVLTQADGEGVEWGGNPYLNLLKNASFERSWPQPAPVVNRLAARFMPFSVSEVLTSFSDWSASSSYYRLALSNLFRTFWAKFGWGHVSLVGSHPYRVLAIVSILGGLGTGLALYRQRRFVNGEILFFLGFATLLVWGSTLARGFYTAIGTYFIPSARYAYPVILPTALVFCLGWLELFRWLNRWLHISEKWFLLPYLVFFIALDVLAVYSVVSFYHI